MESVSFSLHEISLPVEKMDDKVFRHFFMDAMAGKMEAYREMYGQNVVAFDRLDLLSRHFLVCRDTEEGPVPVSGFQVFEMETSDRFDIRMPGLTTSRYSGAKAHEDFIFSEMENAKALGQSLHFYGGFFRIPGTLSREELLMNRMLNTTMIIGHLKQSGAASFSYVSMKANIFRYYQSLGFEFCDFLPDEQVSHPNYRSDLKLIRFEGFKNETIQDFDRWMNYWDERKQW